MSARSLPLQYGLAGLACAVCILLGAAPANAHGLVHERIDLQSTRIEADPLDAEAWRDRGALYALDEDFARAARDLEEAQRLDPTLPGLDLQIANALVPLGELERAEEVLGVLLEARPDDADAYVVRARARSAQGDHDGAQADFARAIAAAETPSPRTYVEQARALRAAGRRAEALGALEAGASVLGGLVVFVEEAVELEAEAGRFDRALAWTDRLEPALRGSPAWRARRAELLRGAGRRTEALGEAREGLAALARLPATRRDTEAAQGWAAALEAEIHLAESAPGASTERSPSPSWWLWGGLAGLLCLLAWGAARR